MSACGIKSDGLYTSLDAGFAYLTSQLEFAGVRVCVHKQQIEVADMFLMQMYTSS